MPITRPHYSGYEYKPRGGVGVNLPSGYNTSGGRFDLNQGAPDLGLETMGVNQDEQTPGQGTIQDWASANADKNPPAPEAPQTPTSYLADQVAQNASNPDFRAGYWYGAPAQVAPSTQAVEGPGNRFGGDINAEASTLPIHEDVAQLPVTTLASGSNGNALTVANPESGVVGSGSLGYTPGGGTLQTGPVDYYAQQIAQRQAEERAALNALEEEAARKAAEEEAARRAELEREAREERERERRENSWWNP